MGVGDVVGTHEYATVQMCCSKSNSDVKITGSWVGGSTPLSGSASLSSDGITIPSVTLTVSGRTSTMNIETNEQNQAFITVPGVGGLSDPNTYYLARVDECPQGMICFVAGFSLSKTTYNYVGSAS
eukprot:GDKI01031853.1.p1 GENE.GDKI01031853.1~~GDKI01031853.1.p1  ORF type:complete len:126 (+),score=29.67 GDKI01031853.1:378-755(+)